MLGLCVVDVEFQDRPFANGIVVTVSKESMDYMSGSTCIYLSFFFARR